MKKIISFIAGVLLLTAAATGQEKKQFQVYGVCFYNLENLFDTINNNGKYDQEFSPSGARQWNGQKYWSKIHNMAYAISHFTSDNTPMGPAVIGVSEIENATVLHDLVRHDLIKKWHLQVVHHDSPDRRGVDVGLLYNPRLFRVLNVTNATVTVEGNPSFRTRDQMCVTGMMGADKVSIIVNHWPSRLGGQEQSSYLREAAAARVMATVDSLLADDPNQGIIVMGDLNDDPQDKSCAVVMGAKKKMGDVKEPRQFFNPWWATLDKGIGTLAYRGQWNLFDQIMISKYFLGDRSRLTYMRHEVLNFNFLKTQEGDYAGYPLRTYSAGRFLNGYSDHFPAQVYLVREVRKR